MIQSSFFDSKKRNIILEKKEEISKLKNTSPFFDDFIRVGLLDFYYVYSANFVSFENSSRLIKILGQISNFSEFYEAFCFNLSLSTDELMEMLFSAMETFYCLSDKQKVKAIFLSSYSTHSKVLASIPEYLDDLFHLCSADYWISYLQQLVLQNIDSYDNKYFSWVVVDSFLHTLSLATFNIQFSILANISIKIGILLYDPKTKELNYENLLRWIDLLIVEQISKRKIRNKN